MFTGAWWWATALVVIDLAIRVLAIIFVPRNRRPTAGMAWLLAIFLIPYFGVIAFLLIGSPKLPRKRREVQDEINTFMRAVSAEERLEDTHGNNPAWFNSLVRMNATYGGLPLLAGNSGTLLSDYEQTIRAMAEAVDGATAYVHVQFYILSVDATTAGFFDALERAIARGVTVNVMLDHWASRGKKDYAATKARLDAMGANWTLMLPLQPLKGKFQRPDLRNHRKILVIDGTVGYMGSLNMISRDYNVKKNIKRGLKWKELVVELRGPGVSTLDAVFISDWYSETGEVIIQGVRRAELVSGGENLSRLSSALIDHRADAGTMLIQVVPSGPGFERENNLRLFLGLIHAAQRRIVITSPYFVPDESLLYAISSAVARGIPVDLFVSEIGDQALVHHAQRSYYEQLLRAGVSIFLYPAPYILHAKHFTIDDEVAMIGSSNMDMRSFSLNMEVSMLVRDAEFVARMRAVEDEYREVSRLLTLEEWMRQPLRSTVLDNLARLTSALQ
ncbi:cardiolipin synthase [Paeniglutamicibacter psychrophenolicus]|uniref:Cardiolipin synthase n=1 Tax=Paeniglutamicibacter psychrophenolicus TaxID=257454 RepID=A0ABS4WDF3_9MICC|nr:cardiolipin synthase [Paeniglutamicibacter psychrophenolicus]MBP2374239.1 cardiolipin synthase [Paeniglutamicibacter psychrophenolicus]